MIRVLVVGSQEPLADRVAEIIQAEELLASTACGREEALWHVDNESPEAVILALGEENNWGEELCREIRERIIAPVLVVGKRGQQLALARGLDAGGDAHVIEPFTRQIFLSQLYALLRRVGLFRPGHAGQFDVGTLAINVFRREVRVEGRPVELTPTEFELLRLLVNNSGRALSYRSLARHALGYDCSSQEARGLLKVHIHHLRKKIEPFPERPAHILNVRGFGYLFERRRLSREHLNEPTS